MPIEGGDVRFFCQIPESSFGYDIEAHARNIGLKYGVEGVTPEVLRIAIQSQDTHVGGCALYRGNPEIVRERLQAIVRAQQGPTEFDYIYDAVSWLVRSIKSAILFIFGLRRPAQAGTMSSTEAQATPEQVVIDAMEGQAAAPQVARTPEQVVIDSMTPSGEVGRRGIVPLFSPQGAQAMVAPQPMQMAPIRVIQMQNGAAIQGAIQMTQGVRIITPPVMMPFVDIP